VRVLRITSLHASQGPGVELLEYLAPRDGRPIPADQRANDIAHWQTTLVVARLDSLMSVARDHRISLGLARSGRCGNAPDRLSLGIAGPGSRRPRRSFDREVTRTMITSRVAWSTRRVGIQASTGFVFDDGAQRGSRSWAGITSNPRRA
jgi:hypothetical protein